MTKTKHFHHGDFEFKAYCKPAGLGWEVGVLCKGEPVFVGNFVHKTEVSKWWTKMCKEMKTFSRHYHFTPRTPSRWYCGFLANHLYKCYYNYLDKVFTTHTRHYSASFAKDVKKYKRFYSPARAA